MRREPQTDWRRRATAHEPPEVTPADATWRVGPVLRRSARAAALTAAAVGLAVFATACSPSPAAVPGSGLASSSASIALVEGPQVVQTGAIVAGVDDAVATGTPTPVANLAPGIAADAVATAEPTGITTTTPPAEDELVAELRAQLSNRSSQRVDEPQSDLAAQAPEIVAVSEKLANARLRSANDPATLSASTGQEGAAMSASTAVQATPKPVVKTPAPAPKVVVQRVVSTPKPVVKTPTPRPVVKTPTPKPATSPIGNLGQRVVSIALRYVGYRYTYGGISPSTGFDCSGFTYFVYGQAGRSIPRSLAGQYGTGAWISRASMQPGDLIFFQGTNGPGLTHVGIYLGGGRFVNAQSERVGVATASLDSYWSPHFLGARRP